MNKMSLLVFKLLSVFIKVDKDLITILFRGYSGSNATPLIERISHDSLQDFKVKVLIEDNRRLKNQSTSEKVKILKNKLERYIYVFKSQLVISTHGFHRLRKDNIMLNLWHGIPLKSMSLMHKGKTDRVGFIQDNYFLSTSQLYNTLMNACLGLKFEQYFVAGYPRNDYFFNQDGLRNLEKIIGFKIQKKVILYMPTYRDVKDTENNSKRDNNFFGFSQFDFKEFNDYLEENNLMFFLKLHPNEENLFIKKYSNLISDNVILLKGDDLENNKIDLYKILNSVDLLITDYSSIYFDYLLLDRPIIFTPSDLEEYRENRGILIEPYDFWTPGPKCYEQNSLQKEIINSIKHETYYKDERKVIRDLIHKYQDGNSTERVVDLIRDIMKK